MSPIYKTLTALSAWILFIFAVISLVVPTVIGISTGALMGTINDIEGGQLWFYRHGLSYLIGFLLFTGFIYAVNTLKRMKETT